MNSDHVMFRLVGFRELMKNYENDPFQFASGTP